MKLLTENYDPEKHSSLVARHDAFGNKVTPENGWFILDGNDLIQKGDKCFDIYEGWLSDSTGFHIINKMYAYYDGGRWTTWERKL